VSSLYWNLLPADGDLLMSYIYNAQTEPYCGHNYYRRSADDVVSWGEQFLLTTMAEYVIMHNSSDNSRIASPFRVGSRCDVFGHNKAVAAFTCHPKVLVTVCSTFQAFQSLFDSHDSLLVVADSIKNTIVATKRFISKHPYGKEKPPANLS